MGGPENWTRSQRLRRTERVSAPPLAISRPAGSQAEQNGVQTRPNAADSRHADRLNSIGSGP